MLILNSQRPLAGSHDKPLSITTPKGSASQIHNSAARRSTHHLLFDAESDLGLDLVHGGRLEASDLGGDVLGSPEPGDVLGMVAGPGTDVEITASTGRD